MKSFLRIHTTALLYVKHIQEHYSFDIVAIKMSPKNRERENETKHMAAIATVTHKYRLHE